MSARMIRSEQEENDFSSVLHAVRAGVRPIGDIQEHSEFLKRARQICRRVVRNNPDASYDVEDLFDDVCMKMLLYKKSLVRKDDLLHEGWPAREGMPYVEEFFKWFYIVALNTFRSRLRKQGRLRRYSLLPIVSVPIEEAGTVIDSSVDLEGECFLGEFLDYINTLPAEHRRAVVLRMEGYSYREIATALNRDGISCSHAGIRKWIVAGLENFFVPAKSLMKRFS